jgi:hypothetical protein
MGGAPKLRGHGDTRGCEDTRTSVGTGSPPQPSLHTHVYKSAGVLKSWSLPHMTWHIIHARMQCVQCTSWQLVLEIEARGFRVTCWRKGCKKEEGMQKGGRAAPCNMQKEARGSPLSYYAKGREDTSQLHWSSCRRRASRRCSTSADLRQVVPRATDGGKKDDAAHH